MKIGILGLGKIARTMAYTVQQMDEASAYAVASRDIEKARAFAKEYGFEHAYGSYEEMVADPEVELIYIATPHSFHFEQAKLCLEHGKHVLCEKTFTEHIWQAKELFQMAEEKGRFIIEAQMVPFMPMAKILKKLIADKAIGETMNLMAHLSYPLTHKERVMKPELAGGGLMDIGIYPLGIANLVFGTDVVRMTSHGILAETGVDGQFAWNLEYPEGKLATLMCSIYTVSGGEAVISGTKGYIEIKDVNHLKEIRVFNEKHELVVCYERPDQITEFEHELRASIQAIRAGKIECEEVSHIETLRVLRMMEELKKEWGCKSCQ